MQYKCSVCGYVYDDSKETVPFRLQPNSWSCPLCHAPKAMFEPIKTEEKPPKMQKPDAKSDETIQKLSAGQLSALFSNLARGCEKQHRSEESKWFQEIADYFSEAAPSYEDASIETLASVLKMDIRENYPLAKATAEENKDRGAQRICVWGEKVTRMAASLVARYQSEGESLLTDLEIWVCTVCGFIWLGEKAPDTCPVCRVPSWKFEKIEGRS